MTILDRVIAAGRPLQVKGKGFLLDPLTPREGSREVTVAGGYSRPNQDFIVLDPCLAQWPDEPAQ